MAYPAGDEETPLVKNDGVAGVAAVAASGVSAGSTIPMSQAPAFVTACGTLAQIGTAAGLVRTQLGTSLKFTLCEIPLAIGAVLVCGILAKKSAAGIACACVMAVVFAAIMVAVWRFLKRVERVEVLGQLHAVSQINPHDITAVIEGSSPHPPQALRSLEIGRIQEALLQLQDFDDSLQRLPTNMQRFLFVYSVVLLAVGITLIVVYSKYLGNGPSIALFVFGILYTLSGCCLCCCGLMSGSILEQVMLQHQQQMQQDKAERERLLKDVVDPFLFGLKNAMSPTS